MMFVDEVCSLCVANPPMYGRIMLRGNFLLCELKLVDLRCMIGSNLFRL